MHVYCLLCLVMVALRPEATAVAAAPPCNLARAVLAHISLAKVAQTKTSRGPARDLADSVGSCPHLQEYITVLPSPPPPPSWTQLCHSVQTGGLAGLARHVSSERCKLPDVQGSAGSHCQLARQAWAYRFKHPSISAFVAAVFYSITAGRTAAAKSLGAPAPQLSRFDLFHGHLFVAPSSDGREEGGAQRAFAAQHQQTGQPGRKMLIKGGPSNSNNSGNNRISDTNLTKQQCSRVGVLFHATEYPAFDDKLFPIHLGHCQYNSTCSYNPRAMDLRNIIWYQGQLAVLDVGQGSPLHAILHEGTEPLRTLYEEDFGQPVADLLMLQEQPRRRRRKLAAAQQHEQLHWHKLLATGQALQACDSSQQGVFVSY